MLDAMFQEGTDKALDDRVSRPLQAPTARPSFGASLWNTTKAPFAGVGAGANESAGFMSDILGAFGAVQAGYGLQADPTLLFDAKEREKRIQAGQTSRDEIQSGEAFSTQLGSGFRATARSFAPDAATANAAEQILFGVTRFGSKAVGYSLLGGPIPGAVVTGADEGMTEADRLKAEGVDLETRTKVGVVAGASSAAAVALPVAGKTLAQTAALVAAGGPGSFIAQQAASRSILENAGYDQLADQYDPFDPVGLAVSTLVPAAFGAHAMRGAARSPKPSPTGDAAAGRAAAEAGRAAASDPEAVAAARVALAREAIESSNLHAADDIRGATDHLNAVMKASDQLAAGERVDVTDLIDSSRIDRRKDAEMRKTVAEMTPDEMRQALLVDDMTGLGNRRAYVEAEKQPFQASLDIDSLKWVNDNFGHDGGDQLISAIGQALREEAAQAYHLSGDEFAAQFHTEADGHALLGRVRERLKNAVIEATLPDGTVITKKGVEFSYGIGQTLETADTRLRADKSAREASGQRAGRGNEPGGVVKKPPAGQQDHQGNAATQAVNPPAELQNQAQGASGDAGKGNAALANLDAQTAELAKLSPDLMVQLEGMDQPMRLADALEAVKAEAAKEAADAPLLQVAAECFLRNV